MLAKQLAAFFSENLKKNAVARAIYEVKGWPALLPKPLRNLRTVVTFSRRLDLRIDLFVDTYYILSRAASYTSARVAAPVPHW
jgi:hypothetical protein